MNALQFVFCFLALVCVAAAAMVALLVSVWFALIPGAGALAFGALVLFTEKKRRDAKRSAAQDNGRHD